MVIFPRYFLALSFCLIAFAARADHEPVEPFDLFIHPPENGELSQDELKRDDKDDRDGLLDDGAPGERVLELEGQEKDTKKAEAPKPNNALPTLSDDREKRLTQLFTILKTTKNPIVAERAQVEIERTWQISGSDTIDLLLSWANDAMLRREYGKALDYLDNIVRLQPDFVEGWNRRATLYFLQKNYDLSINDVERTLALEPRHYKALVGLAMMLRELGNEDEALFALKKAFAVNPALSELEGAIRELEKKLKGRDI